MHIPKHRLSQRGNSRRIHIGRGVGVAVLVVAGILRATCSISWAVHADANFACNRCHTMHYSEHGTTPSGPFNCTTCHGGNDFGMDGRNGPNKHLLLRDHVTDLCMACHSVAMFAHGIAVYNTNAPPDSPDSPGGNFYFVRDAASNGYLNGHNVIWPGVISADPVLSTSPGGQYSSSQLTCISCHDPHGASTDTNPNCYRYRNLKKKIEILDGAGNVVTTVDVSSAIGSSQADEAIIVGAGTGQRALNKNIYKDGTPGTTDRTKTFGYWCSACHGDFHGVTKNDLQVGDGSEWLRHPTGTPLGAAILANYGTNYDYKKPLVEGPSDSWRPDLLAFVSAGSRVFCLTCHKAHATAYPNALRWDAGQPDNGDCNKCHNKGV